MLSITKDAWSSRVYKGYLSLRIYWVDNHWALRHVFLYFVRFQTPQNGNTASTWLFELLGNCNVLDKVRAITTENASDMISAMTKLTNMLNLRNISNCYVSDIHVRFIAHVDNLSMGDCLKDVHIYVNQIRSYCQQ